MGKHTILTSTNNIYSAEIKNQIEGTLHPAAHMGPKTPAGRYGTKLCQHHAKQQRSNQAAKSYPARWCDASRRCVQISARRGRNCHATETRRRNVGLAPSAHNTTGHADQPRLLPTARHQPLYLRIHHQELCTTLGWPAAIATGCHSEGMAAMSESG